MGDALDQELREANKEHAACVRQLHAAVGRLTAARSQIYQREAGLSSGDMLWGRSGLRERYAVYRGHTGLDPESVAVQWVLRDGTLGAKEESTLKRLQATGETWGKVLSRG